MNKKEKELKKELIKRYSYLVSNLDIILLLYYKKYYFNIPKNIILMIEDMLLGDNDLEDSTAFKYFEELKKDKATMEKLQKMKISFEKNNSKLPEAIQTKLSVSKILELVYYRIDNQSNRLNVEAKKAIIDEYYRIFRYSNDGKVWHSGVRLKGKDLNNIKNGFFFSGPLGTEKVSFATYFGECSFKVPKESFPNDSENGVENSEFIQSVYEILVLNRIKSGNEFFLTEKEKQAIYLSIHNELPFDFSIKCESSNTFLNRPSESLPCGTKFRISEEEIFACQSPETLEYSFFYLCPICGYIIEINKKDLPLNFQEKIIQISTQDKNLVRKRQLLSELSALNNK